MYAKLFPAPQHNNWPRCRPFMRHAISEDVPSNRRGLVTRGYWAWIFAAAGFCADWLTITIMCACSLSAPFWDCCTDLHISPTQREDLCDHGLVHGLAHNHHHVRLLPLCTPRLGLLHKPLHLASAERQRILRCWI